MRNMSLKIILVALNICFLAFVSSFDNYTIDSLDGFLQDSALNALDRSRPLTGVLYKGLLPANLSGMEVSIVRLRSKRLWDVGANFSNLTIPKRTETIPHVRRLAIVYQNMGNWSSYYYDVPGYSFVTSVVGFMVFNASNSKVRSIEKIKLDTRGKDIVIRFSNLAFSNSNISRASCIAFDMNGRFSLTQISQGNVCYCRDQGHFSIVLPSSSKPGDQRTRRLWYLWMIGSVLVFCGLGVVGYFLVVYKKVLRTKKIQALERQADEDLVLENKWIGNSKMPSATMARTQPTLENGSETVI